VHLCQRFPHLAYNDERLHGKQLCKYVITEARQRDEAVIPDACVVRLKKESSSSYLLARHRPGHEYVAPSSKLQGRSNVSRARVAPYRGIHEQTAQK
jgi:hypothetical protein